MIASIQTTTSEPAIVQLGNHKQQAFLIAFAKCGNITQAAEVSSVSRRSHYGWVQNDPAYAEAFGDAREESADALETEARRRALADSDTLLIFLLKGVRPEVYRESVDHTHRHAHAHLHATTNEPKSLKAALSDYRNELLAEQAAQSDSSGQAQLPDNGPRDPGESDPGN